MSKSKSKKPQAVERGGKLGWEYGRVDPPGRHLVNDHGSSGYLDFRGYELGEQTRYNSFPRMQGPPVPIQPSTWDTYEGYGDYGAPIAFETPQYGDQYRGSVGYRGGMYGEGSVGYDERRRFSVPIPDYGPYHGFQPEYREATSLPDIRKNTSVEEQIDELLKAVERSSLAEPDLTDMKSEKRRAGSVGDAVVECVALEDLPPVIQTIAIAREDARLEFEDESEMGHEIDEIETGVAPILVDLFELAKVLAQETL